MAALIEIDRLTKKFGETTVVNDVSFSLKKGEVLGFLGPNGAGKSTTSTPSKAIHRRASSRRSRSPPAPCTRSPSAWPGR